MKTGKQQELDLEALQNDFSSSSKSRSREEFSIGERKRDSMEIMRIMLGDSNKEGLLDNLDTSHNEPLVKETKLQQMLSIDLSFNEREEYLHMMKKFPTLFII